MDKRGFLFLLAASYLWGVEATLFVPDFERVEPVCRETLMSEYLAAVENIKAHGEASPPALIVASRV